MNEIKGLHEKLKQFPSLNLGAMNDLDNFDKWLMANCVDKIKIKKALDIFEKKAIESKTGIESRFAFIEFKETLGIKNDE